MTIQPDTLPIILAVLSAFLFALSIQIQNLGLQFADPKTATLVSISTTAFVYWLISPLYLEPAYILTTGTLLFAVVLVSKASLPTAVLLLPVVFADIAR